MSDSMERLPIRVGTDFDVAFNRSMVLPPDEATIAMAHMATNLLAATKVAQRLYTGFNPESIKVVDLGAGSGVIATTLMVSSEEMTDVTLLDVDSGTFNIASLNMANAKLFREEKGLPEVRSRHVKGSWHDESVWADLGPTDLYISNPPYLVHGERVRPGYEHTPADHLYVHDNADLMNNYESIVLGALRRMRTWDLMVTRLPNGERVEEMQSWVNSLSRLMLEELRKIGSSDYHVISTERFKSCTDRPLHALVLQRLPVDYPAIDPTNDARVDIFMRTGKDPGEVSIGPSRPSGSAMLLMSIF